MAAKLHEVVGMSSRNVAVMRSNPFTTWKLSAALNALAHESSTTPHAFDSWESCQRQAIPRFSSKVYLKRKTKKYVQIGPSHKSPLKLGLVLVDEPCLDCKKLLFKRQRCKVSNAFAPFDIYLKNIALVRIAHFSFSRLSWQSLVSHRRGYSNMWNSSTNWRWWIRDQLISCNSLTCREYLLSNSGQKQSTGEGTCHEGSNQS